MDTMTLIDDEIARIQGVTADLEKALLSPSSDSDQMWSMVLSFKRNIDDLLRDTRLLLDDEREMHYLVRPSHHKFVVNQAS